MNDRPGITKICYTAPPPDLASLLPIERQRFGKLVHDLCKQGYDLQTAQIRVFAQVLSDSVPNEKL
jgi:hypothetical protein